MRKKPVIIEPFRVARARRIRAARIRQAILDFAMMGLILSIGGGIGW